MSNYTPTTDEAFNATIYTWVDWKGTFASEEEAADAWTRMIAEVERTASAKGWDEGFVTAAGKAASWNILHGIGVPGLPMTNPYRRNEGGNE